MLVRCLRMLSAALCVFLVSACAVNQTNQSNRKMSRFQFVDPTVVKEGSKVEAPVVITRVEPEYPKELRKPCTHQSVEVNALVRKSGDIEGIRVIRSGSEAFDFIAIKAISQWKYTPAKVDGVPQESFITITVTWRVSC